MAEEAGPDVRAGLADDDSSSGASSSRRPRDAERTRRDILVAAGARFGRRGYSHVTLKEIADDVGVTPAMVVRYFGTKLALFEEVARSDAPALPAIAVGTEDERLLEWARAVLAFFEDRTARAGGIALLRSLDLDDGELFRSEIERRILRPWSKELDGPDAETRLRLVAGVLLGVGMFSLGALIEPERPPLEPEEADVMARYLARILAACIEPLGRED